MHRCFILTAVLGTACGGATRDSATSTGTGSQGDIVAVATESVPIYLRPDSEAVVWATLAPGESVDIQVRTARGWLGFDPGVAQAGNSGSFRYRWLAPGSACSLTGNPELLEVVWGPLPDIAYAMTFEPLAIYMEPDSSSAIVDSLPGNSAASILASLPGWYRIDPAGGPSPGTSPGWVTAEAVSINGDMQRQRVIL